MKISDLHLGFVGFGHMAQVIYRAVDQSKLIPRSQISFIRRDTKKMEQNEKEFKITSTSLENLVQKSDLILIGVRPSQAELVLKNLAKIGVGSKMVISVLAGTKLSLFEKYLGKEAQLLRVMPNMASAVGEGMSVFSYGAHPSNDFRSFAHLLFSSMGQVLEVPEQLMDISCGIAGSGPGFVIALIDAMARTGEKHGLDYQKALTMAAQAFLGAAKVIIKGGVPETLLEQIATPNGTTEAGLRALKETEMKKHLGLVVEASARRSKEISEEKH
ncbi:MAG TPA: pyrroline-5-carboxylate reductase [Chlamydiales bacterium]|nr:pyrroline-5-carboxylate reductase [Chlamydiales bacterium]